MWESRLASKSFDEVDDGGGIVFSDLSNGYEAAAHVVGSVARRVVVA